MSRRRWDAVSVAKSIYWYHRMCRHDRHWHWRCIRLGDENDCSKRLTEAETNPIYLQIQQRRRRRRQSVRRSVSFSHSVSLHVAAAAAAAAERRERRTDWVRSGLHSCCHAIVLQTLWTDAWMDDIKWTFWDSHHSLQQRTTAQSLAERYRHRIFYTMHYSSVYNQLSAAYTYTVAARHCSPTSPHSWSAFSVLS